MTNRFIKIPVKIFSEKTESLTGSNSDNWDATMRLNPLDITSYYNSFDEGDPDKEIVDITFKNGQRVCAYMTINEFEDLLNNYL